MNPKEKFVCALGSGYLMNFLANGLLSKGFAVISDKRVYFKGKTFEIDAKKLRVRTSASTVDLKDVTGTEVRTINFLAILFTNFVFTGLTILFFILMFATTEPHTSGARALATLGLLSFILSVIFAVIYKLSKKTLLSINYAGGNIAFDINWYPRQEGENFQKMLRIAKDNAVEEAQNAAANAVRTAMSNIAPQPQAAASTADELAKYAQLYKDGLISEQEFADVKAKILAKQ